MGVTGLWRLIEPAGKPVPVETLENKVLAVDISIWLHQMVKGYQDAKGAPLPNAHLMGLFQRLCKLLYFRIKPVFVFDGGFPELKKETIARRQDNKAKYNSESERLKRELALILSKKTAISSLLGKDISPKKGHTQSANDDDLFKLPALPENQEESESESEDEQNSSGSIVDLHSVDIQSKEFKSLPAKEKYDLLIELKETRKMNSWGRLHELPKKSDSFSDFQMQRLLKRRKVQECLEETGKEMGEGGLSLNELESLLNEEGIDTKIEALPTRRIASSSTTRYLLINNVKQALADAKKKKELENNPRTSKEEVKTETQVTEKNELEEDLEKAIKMSLECVDEPNTSSCVSKTDDSWTSVMSDSEYTYDSDSEEEDGFEQPDMTSAKAYIMQYSDFTNKAIDKIVSNKIKPANKNKINNVEEIIEEINKEKSVIVDNINLSSDEDSQLSNIECNNKKTEVQDFSTDTESNINQEKPVIVDNINLSSDEHCQPCNKKYDRKQNEVQDFSTVIEVNIDSTQASVICVENTVDNIISLDTSIEDIASQSDLNSGDETSCSEKCFDNPNNKEINGTELNKATLNYADNNIKNEGLKENNYEVTSISNVKVESESNSSDEEFEEVPEIRNESSKTIVQLNLDMGQTCDEKDDIFADIFTGNISNAKGCAENVDENCDNNFKEIKEEDNTLPKCLKTGSPKQNLADNNEEKTIGLVKESETNTIKKSQDLTSTFETIKDSSDSIIKDNVVDTSKVINSDISKTKTIREIITTEKLNEMAEEVANEENELLHEKGRLDRIGRNITEQMTKEAQELLQIFGIPYIVAPMEAEAQCAFLESVKLTDGTITDDSDIWLFGGKTVYKNFFNQKKHVLQYISDRIERSFNLNREQLVLLALLVGSDYTTGVDGVGPVTAMEILASFPYNKKQLLNETTKHGRYQQIVTGLQEFKRWVRAGKRTDNTSLKKKLRNVTLSDEFPSVRVVQAYLEPNIEKSEDKFSWGELDITILRDYTKAKFGWSQNKLDEIINPVLKRITQRKSQKSMQDYFQRKVEFQSLEEHMSKRVKAAVQKLGPEIEDLLETETNEPIPAKRKKTAAKSGGKTTKSKVKSTILPGPSKVNANACEINDPNIVMVSSLMSSRPGTDIVIPKTERFQEIIPQREKDKQSLLQNKMKAIELFRKTKIDRKKKPTKRKVILPKDKAELSESSDSN